MLRRCWLGCRNRLRLSICNRLARVDIVQQLGRFEIGELGRVNGFQTYYSKVAENLHHWRPERPRSSQMHSSHHVVVDHGEKAEGGWAY